MIYNRKNKAEAITQIFILVISIIAISWMIGSEVEEVSADAGCPNFCNGVTTSGKMVYSVYEQKKDINGNCQIDFTKKVQTCSDKCALGVCTGTKSTSSNAGCPKQCAGNLLYTYKKNSAGNCVMDVYAKIERCSNGKKCDNTLGMCVSEDSLDGGIEQKTMSYLKGIATTKITDVTLKKAGQLIKPKANLPGSITPEKSGFLNIFDTFFFGNSATKAEAAKLGINAGEWTGVGGSTVAGAIGSIVVWAGIAFLFGRYVLGKWFNLSTHNSQALGYALATGTAVALTTTSAAIMGGSVVGGPVGIVIGLAVTLVTLVAMWRNASVDVIGLPCYQWEAQSGRAILAGSSDTSKLTKRCDLCNKDDTLPCSEYQCKSLGAGCKLINEEDSGKQLCIWDNPQDITPPIIKPWEEALYSEDFKYTPDNTLSPPDRGVKIVYTGKEEVTTIDGVKCAPPYTRISFGVQLDEPAKCKISTIKQTNFENMNDIYMGRGIREYNQSFILSLPSKEALEAENITVNNGGRYELYVRCEDANGNSNPANFVFKFCISDGPDKTAPKILGTSILNNQPIAYGQRFIDNLYLYVNEPSTCKWSHTDKTYDMMEYNLTCQDQATEINAQMIYSCKANLTEIKDRQPNNFYFRCKDKPFLIGGLKESERNANRVSYPLTLIGTQPLNIDSITPNATIIEDSTDIIKVEIKAETSMGFDEGKAICSFSETGVEGSYVDFFYGYDTEPYSQYQHTQELWLAEGFHPYYIRCTDKGGNTEKSWINFTVKTDKTAPAVVRVYNDQENYLKVITDEPGECVYSTSTCNYLFNEGEPMSASENGEYYVDWNTEKTYYIKCKDEYDNQPPAPSCNAESCKCSIVVRPFEISKAEE